MKRIYKYQLGIEDEQTIEMPKDAQVLSVQTQGGKGTIWALVNEDAPMVPTTFFTFGTGSPLDSEKLLNSNYIGTYQAYYGVWHLFQKVNDLQFNS